MQAHGIAPGSLEMLYQYKEMECKVAAWYIWPPYTMLLPVAMLSLGLSLLFLSVPLLYNATLIHGLETIQPYQWVSGEEIQIPCISAQNAGSSSDWK